MALLASMTAMAQENAKVDVHARYTKVVTPVDGKYESKRPPVEDRLFTSTAVEKKIKEVQKLLKKNPKLAWMFANCYPNTLESTVHYRVLENGDDDTFVYTGDIPAMWLRDSGAQVWPYVALANKDEKLKKMLKGVILRQLKCINIDRYANAFNDGPTGAGWVKDRTKMQPDVFERKYEIDSFCYPIRLAYEYWKVTGDDSIFGEVWMQAVENILKTFHEQQRKVTAKAYHFTRVSDRAFDTIGWDGFGAPVKPVGLIASMFRPSDDATILPFLIPSNFMAVSSMNKAAEILKHVAEKDAAKKEAALKIAKDCSSLASITLPDGVMSVGDAAFSGCGSLTSIMIPDSVTDMGNGIFKDCISLTSIILSDGVTRIGNEFFTGCVALKSVIYDGTKAQWSVIRKGRDWDSDTGAYTIHCLDGYIAKQ